MTRPMPGWKDSVPLGCFAGVFWLPATIDAADLNKDRIALLRIERFTSTAKAIVHAWNTRHPEDWVPWMLWADSQAAFDIALRVAQAFGITDSYVVGPTALAALYVDREDRYAILFAAGLGAAKPAEEPATPPLWARRSINCG